MTRLPERAKRQAALPPNESYPSWSGPRTAIRDALSKGGGRVAGRYLRGTTRDLLEDESGVVEVTPGADRPQHGDHVVATLRAHAAPPHALVEPVVLAPARGVASDVKLGRLRPALRSRARIVQGIRDFFTKRGFLEVETPARAPNPGLELHLRPFPAGSAPDGSPRWLVTSPELHLKRLLAAGYERVFELARCFRDDEEGALHAAEFLMLEWYRTHAGLDALASDLESLLPAAAKAAGLEPESCVTGCDITASFERTTVAALFKSQARVDTFKLTPEQRDRVFVDIEPRLGRKRPLLVTEYPADAAALARLVPSTDDPRRQVAARMELYVAGMELANGFDELTDPVEQRARHERERAARLAAGQPAPPLDDDFLAALESGVPPSAGMALGVDRLVMLLLGKRDISEVRAFVR